MTTPDKLFDELTEKIRAYNPSSDIKKIKKAYGFAKEAHSGQKRRSGEEYIIHPIYAAINLTRIEADDQSIISALLHDVPEDTDRTNEDIKTIFGEEIALIVEGVTKLSKVHYDQNMKGREVDSLRKLFLSTGKDIRVILVKIADRLHNLSTLDSLRPDKRVRIATETMEIYLPVIKLLGVGEFIHELEDLCFRYVKEEEYNKIYSKISLKYDYYNKKIKTSVLEISKELEKNWIKAKVTGRIKTLYSIYKKNIDKKSGQFEILDVMAFKVVVKGKEDCYKVLGLIHSIYKVRYDRFKDYISSPKKNGYRGIHTTVFDFDGELIEFQIVDEEMDKVNIFGVAPYYIYKNKMPIKNTPTWVQDILDIQKIIEDPELFMDRLKTEVLSSNIQCFTPKGNQVILPKKAILLDFAYKIHSDFGNQFLGAYINGTYTEDPTTKLNKGDIVKLILGDKTNENFDVEYIGLVKTNIARENLKKLFKAQEEEKKEDLGKFLIDKKLDSVGLNFFENLPRKTIDSVLKKYNSKDIKSLFVNIGAGNIDINNMLKFITKINHLENSHLKGIKLKIETNEKTCKTADEIINIFIKSRMKIEKFNYKGKKIEVYIKTNSLGTLSELFTELKRNPNIKSVKRLFPTNILIFNIIFFSIVTLSTMQPILIKYTSVKNYFIDYGLISDLIFMSTFATMIFLIYFFRYIVKTTMPDRFNSTDFWISMFTLNTVISGIILFETYYLNIDFEKYILISISILIYVLLYLEYKKTKFYKLF